MRRLFILPVFSLGITMLISSISFTADTPEVIDLAYSCVFTGAGTKGKAIIFDSFAANSLLPLNKTISIGSGKKLHIAEMTVKEAQANKYSYTPLRYRIITKGTQNADFQEIDFKEKTKAVVKIRNRQLICYRIFSPSSLLRYSRCLE